MARSYAPFGEVLSGGRVGTAYGYTGEWTDATGLVHLRARYHAPWQGRFITRDVWPGDYQRPLSLNRWNYVQGNPINYIDPSGYCIILTSKTEPCNVGQALAGAGLIVFTDLTVGLPAAVVIIIGGVGSPPALAAEALEIAVVLPLNLFGLYLIGTSGCGPQ